jgi:hypothetical protein
MKYGSLSPWVQNIHTSVSKQSAQEIFGPMKDEVDNLGCQYQYYITRDSAVHTSLLVLLGYWNRSLQAGGNNLLENDHLDYQGADKRKY